MRRIIAAAANWAVSVCSALAQHQPGPRDRGGGPDLHRDAGRTTVPTSYNRTSMDPVRITKSWRCSTTF